MTRYEEALLTELREAAAAGTAPDAARPVARRGRTLAGLAAAGAAVAAITGALILGPSSETPAYSLVDRSDGTIELQIFDWKGVRQANERLAEEGINARVYDLVGPGECPEYTWGERSLEQPEQYVDASDRAFVIRRDIPEGYTAMMHLQQGGYRSDPDSPEPEATYFLIGTYTIRGEAPPCAQAQGPMSNPPGTDPNPTPSIRESRTPEATP